MTPEQITTWAKQSLFDIPLYDYQKLQLQRFAQLVRNEALEEAAAECEKECDNWDNERPLRICAATIRNLKS